MATFTTKYNWGQQVWYLGADGKSAQGRIDTVTVQVQKDFSNKEKDTATQYNQYLINDRLIGEDMVFANQQELIDYVIG